MTMGNTSIEVERPVNWKGEDVDMRTFDGEIDYYEVEVEGDVNVYTDYNYGADADGNRGERQDFSEVEDLTFTLYGDFRPRYIKIRDFFILKWRNRNLSPRWTSTGPQVWFFNAPKDGEYDRRSLQHPVIWTQLSSYGWILVDESAFTGTELASLEESLIENARDADLDWIEDSCWAEERR